MLVVSPKQEDRTEGSAVAAVWWTAQHPDNRSFIQVIQREQPQQ